MSDDKLLFQCECGGFSFRLLRNGKAKCENCGYLQMEIDVSFPEDVPILSAEVFELPVYGRKKEAPTAASDSSTMGAVPQMPKKDD